MRSDGLRKQVQKGPKMLTVGITRYSEDGKKSVTITGEAPIRRDRYHADYYPVNITANGVTDYDRLSHGAILARFPRTEPKPETGKTINTVAQMANAIKKTLGTRPTTSTANDNYYRARRFGYLYMGATMNTDEFEICNLEPWMELKLIESGFEGRKVAHRGNAITVWSK